jgi:NADH-quinone oxidoreductase subunit M
LAAISATAVILAAMYLLTMYQKLMFGPLDKPENKAVKDIHGRETWVFGIVVLAAVVMGLFPGPILARSAKSVEAFVSSYRDRLGDARRDVDAPAHIYPAIPSTAPSTAPAPAGTPAGTAPLPTPTAAPPTPTPTPTPAPGGTP